MNKLLSALLVII